MQFVNSKLTHLLMAFSYLLLLSVTYYWGLNIKLVEPTYYLMIGLVGLGLVLTIMIFFLLRKAFHPGPTKIKCIGFLLFQMMQGAGGYAIARYVFDMPLLSALVFPLGALVALLIYAIIENLGAQTSWTKLLVVALLGIAVAVSLRLYEIYGSLILGIALMNSYVLGFLGQRGQVEKQNLWVRAILFTNVLIIGRACLQYFLQETGYASLGVVITIPYSFMALFGGLLVPFAYHHLEREKLLPKILLLLLMGILLPLTVGLLIHIRPTGAYLLGIIFSLFAVGILESAALSLSLLGYLNLSAVILGLPLFEKYTDLSRVIRLEVLGGLLVLMILLLALSAKFYRPSSYRPN